MLKSGDASRSCWNLVLQASRRSGGYCDSSLKHVRRCAGTGTAPNRYRELNCSEVRCAGFAP